MPAGEPPALPALWAARTKSGVSSASSTQCPAQRTASFWVAGGQVEADCRTPPGQAQAWVVTACRGIAQDHARVLAEPPGAANAVPQGAWRATLVARLRAAADA